MAISNQVSAMRQGKVTANIPTSQTNPRELAKYMVGREVLLRVSKKARDPGKEVMKVENLRVLDNRKLEAVKNLSFSVCAGEIVGIAGVAGNGQTELVEAIAGLRKPQSGKIWLQGSDIAGLNPKEIRELGLSHIPEDRLKHALIKPFPVFYNMLLGRHDQSPFAKHGFLQHKSIHNMANRLVEAFDVRPKSIDILGGNLSGGNQQKAIVAREIDMNPTIMLVAQPTRGLDIGAIEYIHKTLLEMRNSDVGMLLVSMELEEVFSLSDRILVIYEGTIMGEVRPEETNFEEVGYMMAGNPASEVLTGPS
jgi:simple sugar transport system ATP-binding protein